MHPIGCQLAEWRLRAHLELFVGRSGSTFCGDIRVLMNNRVFNMQNANSFRWFAWALLAGALYLVIGVGFARLSVPSVFFWRLAAWIVSAGVYAAHIGYEHFRIRSSLHSTALHVAFGAAIGAFGLAAIANVHSLLTGTGNLRLLRLALLIWPLITGVPAYVVAFVFTAVLFRVLRRREAISGH